MSLLSFCKRPRLLMAAVRASIGLPAADHCSSSGTALSSPNEPKARTAALRRNPSGESAATAASSVAKALGAFRLECLQRRGARAIGLVLFGDGIEPRYNGRVILEIAESFDDAVSDGRFLRGVKRLQKLF